MMLRFTAVLAPALLLGTSAAQSRLLAQRVDTTVRMVAVPRHQSTALIREVSIGGANADETAQFVSIREVLPAQDRSVWVIDGRFPIGVLLVRQYDSAGRFVRQVGGRGNGPGEYQYPVQLAQLGDGRVAVRDDHVGKPVTLYHPSGNYDTTWAFAAPPTFAGVDTSGNILMWVQGERRAGARGPGAGGPPTLVRFRADGSVVDTVVPPAIPSVERASSITVTGTTAAGGRASRGVTIPFQPYGIRVWSPMGYFATARGDRYEVNIFAADGRVLSVRRDVAPVRMDDAEYADQTAYVEAQVEYLRQQISGQRSGATPEIPREKPPVGGVFFALDGKMWVQVAVPSERFNPPEPFAVGNAPVRPVLAWRERLAYDVYGTDFALLGRVVLPTGVGRVSGLGGALWARGDHIWCVAVDVDGVEEIRRYRIVWR